MKTLHLILTAISISLLAAACAPDTNDVDSADQEVSDVSEADLTAAGKKLVGAYAFSDNNNRIAFAELVLNSNGSFVAEVTRLCRAPICDGRLEGTYSATSTFVTLKPQAGAPTDLYYGKYRYKLTGAGTATKITLSRDGAGWSGWSNQATKLPEQTGR
jgi:hypothetical protein